MIENKEDVDLMLMWQSGRVRLLLDDEVTPAFPSYEECLILGFDKPPIYRNSYKYELLDYGDIPKLPASVPVKEWKSKIEGPYWTFYNDDLGICIRYGQRYEDRDFTSNWIVISRTVANLHSHVLQISKEHFLHNVFMPYVLKLIAAEDQRARLLTINQLNAGIKRYQDKHTSLT